MRELDAGCTPVLQLKQSPSWVEVKPDCDLLIHGKLLNSIGGSLPPSIMRFRPRQKEVKVVDVSTSQPVQVCVYAPQLY